MHSNLILELLGNPHHNSQHYASTVRSSSTQRVPRPNQRRDQTRSQKLWWMDKACPYQNAEVGQFTKGEPTTSSRHNRSNPFLLSLRLMCCAIEKLMQSFSDHDEEGAKTLHSLRWDTSTARAVGSCSSLLDQPLCSISYGSRNFRCLPLFAVGGAGRPGHTTWNALPGGRICFIWNRETCMVRIETLQAEMG